MNPRAIEKMPYRPCVGAMIINREGLVFVGRRIDRAQAEEAWQMPQGGIDAGEDVRTAVFREMEEEIGTNNAQVLAEHSRWLNYDLPEHLLGVALKGRYRGQTQKWFLLRFKGDDVEIDLNRHLPPEFDAWKWAPLEGLVAMAVPFKRDVYSAVIEEFAQLVTPDA
ncbi:MAG: RNA pyrophosphohydrolase [Alphaproteobacteria bacterium]|nr:RNA pyrophosphohydrolase [Alphaproteobacteria bacterium]